MFNWIVVIVLVGSYESSDIDAHDTVSTLFHDLFIYQY